ncbi:MAG: hypothetical protein JSS86_25270 [Cyanobacteria bacterium SZAS LIN-2]|nr:hypothetical protein [Cyanobacteria bacterium SZAS LIN-2]
MPDPEKNKEKPTPPHLKLSPEERAAQRAFNTPDNAIKALASARESIRFLKPGKVWMKKSPRGEFEIKGSLMLEEFAALALHFNPEDGSVLPKGLHGLTEARPEIPDLVQAQLHAVAAELEVLDGAEFREPESCWAVPVAYRNRIVGHIKISADGSDVLADKKAMEEGA